MTSELHDVSRWGGAASPSAIGSARYVLRNPCAVAAGAWWGGDSVFLTRSVRFRVYPARISKTKGSGAHAGARGAKGGTHEISRNGPGTKPPRRQGKGGATAQTVGTNHEQRVQGEGRHALQARHTRRRVTRLSHPSARRMLTRYATGRASG